MRTVRRALLIVMLFSFASRAQCSLERACCSGSFADVLAEPSCAVKVAAGGAGAVYGIPLVLGALGFGLTGPIGGSIAAFLQSAGWLGSGFGLLQKVGMIGVGKKGAMIGASAAYNLCCAGVKCAVS